MKYSFGFQNGFAAVGIGNVILSEPSSSKFGGAIANNLAIRRSQLM
ncbi:hypothetical protein Mesop_4638 [Mesorhizobium opportunistum WSM2075]|uniref:Uncharacterized protein n=1 Tax=Mesorhizobium opportunistum (strain LMG 24607 / HAMBI 3007 / WSM2075) TaxID=536019 RepID=F7YDV8_MESOW|nr:hypothetical protein Mesop_4638 [Mesorhizobium opportunistum WSM2075]